MFLGVLAVVAEITQMSRLKILFDMMMKLYLKKKKQLTMQILYIFYKIPSIDDKKPFKLEFKELLLSKTI